MFSFFFFNDTATTEIYTLSLHDALPISDEGTVQLGLETIPVPPDRDTLREIARVSGGRYFAAPDADQLNGIYESLDRKSTRLNSSHANISYAVFCLKKKKNQLIILIITY